MLESPSNLGGVVGLAVAGHAGQDFGSQIEDAVGVGNAEFDTLQHALESTQATLNLVNDITQDKPHEPVEPNRKQGELGSHGCNR